MAALSPLFRERLVGDGRLGITAVCTAHPLAIEAALRLGRISGSRVLIEATCNQVNQDGGYTGMTPAAFRDFVRAIAERVGFPPDNLLLGGDHLGPNPWKTRPADEAMAKAATMIKAYAEAGFTKLHLDTSMGCLGEASALPDEVTAERAAALAKVAEAASSEVRPIYVIGTEVPVPGGAQHALDGLVVTRPEAALRTVEVHRRAFARAGVEAAFSRIVGVVVQPGVEFGNADVMVYDRPAAAALREALPHLGGAVFEAHSTDYQPAQALRDLVEDGFAILKVGPWLTFAMRQALYGLDAVARVLGRTPRNEESLLETMERVMLARPNDWAAYYPGDPASQHIQRHFSYSDRIRYYWPEREAQLAVERLLGRLGDDPIPMPLVGQFLGWLLPEVADGRCQPRAHDVLIASVQQVLAVYGDACRPT